MTVSITPVFENKYSLGRHKPSGHATGADYSGEIGRGTREHLLTELTELDGQRARLARERGRDFLASANQREHDLDLMIMGAFGHTRIREMLLGSTTRDMIRRADVPLLIVR